MRQPVKFGKYLLLDRISVGGMAEVFKAKTFGVEGFEKIVAVKRILPAMGKDQDFIDMFIDEAKIAGQLAHANIGQIHELGKVEDAHFIAMEFIWGRDLLQVQNRYKKRKQRLSVRTACFIVMKICDGLDYAHKKRDMMGDEMLIVHRDCSPQNVVISFEGEVKLIDFGIAKAASRSAHTTAGVLKGKFGYMSPEQVRGLPLDRRTDIFSIGTILFESLTGRRLFNGESDFTTLEKVRNAIIERHYLAEAEVPEEVQKIVFKALERNAENRYQWCAELRDDLHAFLQKGDAVYTNRILGEEMRGMFVDELQRERELMDLYSKIDSNGVLADGTGQVSTEVLVDRGSVPKPAGLASGSQPRARTHNDGEFEDSPTEIFGEFNLSELIGDLTLEPEPNSGPISGPNSGPISGPISGAEEKITLLEPEPSTIERKVEIPSPILKASTLKATELSSSFSARKGTGTKGLISDDGVQPFGSFAPPPSVAVLTPKPALPIMPTMQVPKLPPPGEEMGARVTGVYNISENHVKRNVVLGVASIIAIVLLAIGAKFIFFGAGDSSEIRVNNATLVVLGDDKPGAEVFIDESSYGIVPTGDALTLDTLGVGSHKIRLIRKGVILCQSSIDLSNEKVKVFNCNTVASLPTTLTIDGLMTGDSLLLDGQVVSPKTFQTPLVLTADALHVFALSRTGKDMYEFKVTLKQGEQANHKIVWPETKLSQEPDAELSKEDVDQPTDEVMEMEPESLRPVEKEPKVEKDENVETGSKVEKDVASANPDEKVELGVTAPALDANGYFTAWSRPWARIYIDGKDTGKVTPVVSSARISLRPGTHKVAFVVGSVRHEFSVKIKAGETTRLAKILE